MSKLRSILLTCVLAGAAFGAALPAGAQVVYGGAYVRVGPPAPIVETVPVAPGPGYIWTAGHWYWNGARYVWYGGRYVRRPYRGAYWHPGRWVRNPYGWRWRRGYW